MSKYPWVHPVFLFVFVFLATLGDDLLGYFGVDVSTPPSTIILYTIQVALWLAIAMLGNRLAQAVITRALGEPVPRLIIDVTTIVIYLAAVVCIVGLVFNKPVTGIWATSGVIGIVLGLALRNIILDLFIGIATNVERPYKIGDWITFHPARRPEAKIHGQLVGINWRTTRIQTTSDNIVIFPNSLMGTSIITNHMIPINADRRETMLTVDHSVPLERARRVLLAGVMAVIDDKHVKRDPPPRVLVAGTNSVGVMFKIHFYSRGRRSESFDRVLSSVMAQLQQAGIPLAYPKQDVFYTEATERSVDSTSIEGLAELMKRTELFENLQAQELQHLATTMTRHDCPVGATIIEASEGGNSMLILVEGLLEVFMDMESGKSTRVGQIVPGQFVGERSLLTGEPRLATVKAVTSAVVYQITKENIKGLLEKRPEIATILSEKMAQRQLRSSEAFALASTTEQAEQQSSLADQILDKMRCFFKGVSTK